MMLTLNDCRKAAREIRTQLNRLLGENGIYKTSSSWSDVKYVTITYNLFHMYGPNREVGLFATDYDENDVLDIYESVCKKYNISDNRRGIHMYETKIEINLYSEEPAR